jgi:hypothetical protein
MGLYSRGSDRDQDSDSDSDSDTPSHSDEIKSAVDLVHSGHPTTLSAKKKDSINMDLWTQEMERRGFTIQQNWKKYRAGRKQWECDEYWHDEDIPGPKLKESSVWLHADQIQHVYCYIMSMHQHDGCGDMITMNMKADDRFF